MLEEIDRESAQETEREIAEMRRQDAAIQRVLDKYKERVERAIEKDPELRGLRDKIEKEERAITYNNRLSNEEREERYKQIAPEVEKFRRAGNERRDCSRSE